MATSWLKNLIKYQSVLASLNGQYIHESQTVPGKEFTCPNNVTWTAADNGAGKVRLTASGAHGLTTAKSDGKYLQLRYGGTGWTSGSDHQIDPSAGYIDATNIDLTTTYTEGMGVPVFVVEGVTPVICEIVHKEITLPALRANSMVIVEYEMVYASSTNSKRVRFTLEGTNLAEQNTTAANEVIPHRHGFRNQNSTSAQRSITGNNGTGYVGGTGSMVTASVATGTAGKIIKISSMISAPDITAQLNGYSVLIRG